MAVKLKMHLRPLVSGVLSVLMPIPIVIVTMMLGLCVAWVWYALFELDNFSSWFLVIAVIPLLLSPIFSIFSTVYCAVKIRVKWAWIGLLLSIFGIAENAGLMFFLYYIGSVG